MHTVRMAQHNKPTNWHLKAYGCLKRATAQPRKWLTNSEKPHKWSIN
ncbi:Uncharacterised protein [Vibrio cholerae]|nr:Uncharacterised protein [Vibrio cholerae]